MEVRKTKCSIYKRNFTLNVVLQDQDTNMLLLMHAYSVFNEENPTDVTINFFAWQNKRMGTDSNCLSQATKPAVSDLESSMLTIIQTFHQYSGQKSNLKKADLKELINNEMNNFIVVRYLLQSGCVYDT